MPNVIIDIVEMPRSRRIGARIPYLDGKGPLAAKRIDGYKWDPKIKMWTYPLDMTTCSRLREVFGKSLQVGAALRDWYRAEADRVSTFQTALQGFSVDKPMDLPVVAEIAPQMYQAMLDRGYQTIVPRFAEVAGNFLLADQPGLGKTLEVFASLLQMRVRGHVLVIAPKTSLEATWLREVHKWLAEVGAVGYVADGPAAKRQQIIEEALADTSPLVFVMVNAEMVRLKEYHDCNDPACEGSAEFCRATKVTNRREGKFPILHDTVWDFIVGDEVHRYLMHANPRARQKSQVGLGFQRLQTKQHEHGKIAVSGTPMRGKPRLLWPTFHWLRPDLYNSQWRWSKHYFKTEADSYATSGEKVTDDLRPEREAEFNAELGRMMIRRTKGELRAMNPAWAPADKRYAEVWLRMTPEQARLYKQMEKSASARMVGGTLSANGVLAEMTRLRQFANSAGVMQGEFFHPTSVSNKIDWLMDSFLPERGIYGKGHAMEEGDSKVVIASQFTQFLEVISEVLDKAGIEHYVMTGKTNKGSAFARMQDDWQTPGGPRVLLMNTMAGGVSITLDYADEMVVLDETWVPDDQEQLEDRIHRTSRTDHQVTIWYVRSEDSIERDLAGTNEMKDDRQKRSLDGRRGVEIAKNKFKVDAS